MEYKRVVSQNNELLKRIVNRIIIKSCDLSDLGLFHGKMGFVIFFFHYAAFTKNPIYENFAGQLLDQIFEDIHNKLSIDLENGYCGIGWGIEYLSQNNFIEGDTNKILESIDNKVMEWNLSRVTDLSLKSGIAGVFHYVLCRLNNKILISPFDEAFLSDLDLVVSKNYSVCNAEMRIMFDYYREWIESKRLRYKPIDLLQNIVCSDIGLDNQNITHASLGMENGCAGYGLNELLFRR